MVEYQLDCKGKSLENTLINKEEIYMCIKKTHDDTLCMICFWKYIIVCINKTLYQLLSKTTKHKTHISAERKYCNYVPLHLKCIGENTNYTIMQE